jgi:thioredoxin 2
MADMLKFADGKLEMSCSSCDKVNSVPIDRIQQGPVCGSCKAGLTVDMPIEATDQNFDDLIGKSPLPVMVDFWAPWCGPCRMMGPALQNFARRNSSRVLVAKLNTQQNSGTPGRFGIKAIPTLIVFKGSNETRRQVGAVPEQALDGLLA